MILSVELDKLIESSLVDALLRLVKPFEQSHCLAKDFDEVFAVDSHDPALRALTNYRVIST